jgi:hypothetical protein
MVNIVTALKQQSFIRQGTQYDVVRGNGPDQEQIQESRRRHLRANLEALVLSGFSHHGGLSASV